MADQAVKQATAAALKAWRKNAKLTQTEAAELLHTSQVNVSRWENGYTTPNAPDMVNMMAAYNVTEPIAGLSSAIATAQSLLGGKEPKWQQQPRSPQRSVRRRKSS